MGGGGVDKSQQNLVNMDFYDAVSSYVVFQARVVHGYKEDSDYRLDNQGSLMPRKRIQITG